MKNYISSATLVGKPLFDANFLFILAYLLLLIFEGSFRKWLFPSLADIFLLIRDPLFIFILWRGYRLHYYPSYLTFIVLSFSFVELFVSFAIGTNLLVAMFGLRTMFLHFYFIFFSYRSLTLAQVRWLIRFLLLLSLPYCLLVISQNLLGRAHFLNIGVGGEGTSAFSVSGAGAEEIRPSGTFSFATGSISFITLTLSLALARILAFANITLASSALAASFLSVFFTVSRTLYFSSGLSFFIFLFQLLLGSSIARIKVLCLSLFLAFSLFMTIIFVPSIQSKLSSFEGRWQSSVVAKGGFANSVGFRVLDSLFALDLEPIEPLLGVGTGAGTRVGQSLLGKDAVLALGEADSYRTINELGYLRGLLYLLFRYILGFHFLMISWRHRFFSSTGFLVVGSSIPFFFIGQFAQPAILGFACFTTGFGLALSQYCDRDLSFSRP